MRALVIDKIGEAKEVISIVDREKPICKDNEALVKMIKSPINPADILFIRGKYRRQPILNQIVGFEGVGIIEDTGSNCQLRKGSLVAFRHQNVWAEYVTVPSHKLTILPDSFPTDKASQFSLNPITAKALIQESNLKEGDWLILTAGASSVSKLIIQLLRTKNIKTIAIVRDIEDTKILKTLGVDIVLRTDENVGELIPSIIDEGRVQTVIDAIGGNQTSDLIKVISPNGYLLLYGLQSQDNVQFHNADLIFKNLTIKGFGIDEWLSHQSNQYLQQMKQDLIADIESSHFIMPVDSVWKIQDFQNAFLHLEANKLEGKVLLSFI